ncbi:hypothetical protein SUVZ_09G1430 [Saccharomyces uvarum]|uniref:Uncharacterized protein n=1 Tax=Saccharomyces uvarum TaxID=230603 RepID=A0ABN8WYN7_SACUV|nr:hypothetical protein SUVZ_09G1430 [Saccharomyces uvarum]
MQQPMSEAALMGNETVVMLESWMDSIGGNCCFSYTTAPELGDYILNVSAIDGMETLVETKLVPTLENATQWVNDMSDFWSQFDNGEEPTYSTTTRLDLTDFYKY